MLLDHRTYTVRAGTLRKQLALYEKHGFAAQMHVRQVGVNRRVAFQLAAGRWRNGTGTFEPKF